MITDAGTDIECGAATIFFIFYALREVMPKEMFDKLGLTFDTRRFAGVTNPVECFELVKHPDKQLKYAESMPIGHICFIRGIAAFIRAPLTPAVRYHIARQGENCISAGSGYFICFVRKYLWDPNETDKDVGEYRRIHYSTITHELGNFPGVQDVLKETLRPKKIITYGNRSKTINKESIYGIQVHQEIKIFY